MAAIEAKLKGEKPADPVSKSPADILGLSSPEPSKSLAQVDFKAELAKLRGEYDSGSASKPKTSTGTGEDFKKELEKLPSFTEPSAPATPSDPTKKSA